MATINHICRAYAMEYGTFVGLGWGALFLSYVEGIGRNSLLLMLLCFALCGVCLLLPFFFAFRLNRKLYAVGERLSYWQGALFSFSMFMYACLMNGLLVFAYFQWIDDGTIYAQLSSMMTQPEMVEAYEQLGMGQQYGQVRDMVNELEGLSALDKALLVFNNNFLFGLALSFITAVVASCNWKNLNNQSKA